MSTSKKKLIEGAWTLPEFEYLANNQWTFTEKVDGTNIRVMIKGVDITFGGRTDNAQISAELIKYLEYQFLSYSVKGQINALFPETEVILYGEGYGPKIQSGGKYRPDQSFVLFDVRIGQWWLQRVDVEDIARHLGLDVVPIIGEGTLYDVIDRARYGIISTWGDFEAEGIVARPKVELKTRSGERIITKIKCRDFI